MKKAKKILTLVCCAVLLVCISVGATIAYLTSTDSVTNTFTVGKVKITLDESDVYDFGAEGIPADKSHGEKIEGAERVKANEYKLFPGKTYDKDPIVHVGSDSEDCWIYVKLENGIESIQDADTIEAQMLAKNWVLIDETDNIYAYKFIVSKNANIPVFDYFKIKGDVSEATLASHATAKVKVTAYAIQAAEFEGATGYEDAWTAANGQF